MTKAYDVVLRARAANRPCASRYIEAIIDDFIELKGDRCFGDDRAIIGGIGFLFDTAVTVLGIEKGNDTKERIEHNFGSAYPEGYRKALRLAKQAEKFGRPLVCFVDTAGAYPGVDAENRGQGQAIAECLYELSTLGIPIISIVIGEGGSGGALALCQGDKIWVQQDAYFSVVSPENCANILWKDLKLAPLAAAALKLTAGDLLGFGIIDKIISEPPYCEDGFGDYAFKLKNDLYNEIKELNKLNWSELINNRYEKFRQIGY